MLLQHSAPLEHLVRELAERVVVSKAVVVIGQEILVEPVGLLELEEKPLHSLQLAGRKVQQEAVLEVLEGILQSPSPRRHC